MLQPRTKANAEARVRELEAEVRQLMLERDTLRKGGGVLRAGAGGKYAFIRDELAGACMVRMACRLLEVSPSGHYRFLKAPVAARKVRRLAVEDAVVRIHAESRRIYSAPKIAHELPRLGVPAHRNTVLRIMQEHGKRAKSARKWRPTMTQSGHGHGASPDLLGRDFAADGPNRKWLCEITYVPTDEGFLHLAGVMDA